MVTKGYQKGVYEWVTKGIRGWNGRKGRVWLYRKDGGKWLDGLSPADLVQIRYGAGLCGSVLFQAKRRELEGGNDLTL
jgi:hypothetical protein